MHCLHGWFAEIVFKRPHLLLPAARHGPIPAPVLTNSVQWTLWRQSKITGQNGTICREIMLGNHPVGHRYRAGLGVGWFIRDGIRQQRQRHDTFDRLQLKPCLAPAVRPVSLQT